jgi:hypothetical protein
MWDQATDVPDISETNSNIRLWNVGVKRKHKIQIKSILKKSIKKNLRTHQKKWWYMAD